MFNEIVRFPCKCGSENTAVVKDGAGKTVFCLDCESHGTMEKDELAASGAWNAERLLDNTAVAGDTHYIDEDTARFAPNGPEAA